MTTSALHFGRFSVDARGERALFDAEPVRLRRKAREVLAYLVVHQDRVVTIDELLDSLWPGLAVTPHSVAVIISTLRSLLARDESQSCSIESAYGRGYRFILHTAPHGTAQTTASEPVAVGTRTSECVARAAELTQLERCRDLVRDGIAQVVLLGGDSGIGKSSLVREFTRRTTETTDALVFTGSCHELVSAPEPYQPVLEILEGLEKHLGGSELAQHMRRVAPTWLVQFPWLATTEEIVELRRSLAGTHGGQVLRELRRLLDDIATDRTIVILFEDLHRAETATIDFVRSVARKPFRSRVLLLATYRPLDAAIGRSEILGLRGASKHVVHVDLDPWDQAGIESYLRSRFGTELSRSFVTDLERRSRGVPLLVTAMLDAMVRDGALAKLGDHWSVDESVDARHATLPDEVRSLARQQFDRLPKADRTLLEVAAVFGQEFFASDIATVAGLDPEDCADRLAELCEHRFFIAHNDPLATVGDHAFLHAAYRQAILESLPALRSRQLHRQAAEQIVKSPGDRRRADDLAAKFSAGHAWEQAADQWERAAARAVQQYAHAEAAGFVRRAIEAIEHERPSRKRDTRLAERYLDLANLSIVAVGYAEGTALESFAQARQLAEGCAADRVAFRARAGETIVSTLNGRLDEAAVHATALESVGLQRPEWRSMTSLYVAYVEGFS
ncbi:MAG: ATP-binding protein, partial [Kofleriaceae bacterium]